MNEDKLKFVNYQNESKLTFVDGSKGYYNENHIFYIDTGITAKENSIYCDCGISSVNGNNSQYYNRLTGLKPVPKIVSQVKKASYANTLTLVAKVNCDKDETKFDFYQFFNTLEYVSFKKYIETKDVNLYKLYTYINKTKQSYLNKKIAKEAFMLNFLDGLWRLEH